MGEAWAARAHRRPIRIGPAPRSSAPFNPRWVRHPRKSPPQPCGAGRAETCAPHQRKRISGCDPAPYRRLTGSHRGLPRCAPCANLEPALMPPRHDLPGCVKGVFSALSSPHSGRGRQAPAVWRCRGGSPTWRTQAAAAAMQDASVGNNSGTAVIAASRPPSPTKYSTNIHFTSRPPFF
jgi:hypothetical protein